MQYRDDPRSIADSPPPVPHFHIHVVPRTREDPFQGENNDKIYDALAEGEVAREKRPARTEAEMTAESTHFKKMMK